MPLPDQENRLHQDLKTTRFGRNKPILSPPLTQNNMRSPLILLAVILTFIACNRKSDGISVSHDAADKSTGQKQLYIDVHDLDKVTFADVEAAHKKDLETQGKYGVRFIKYWVDESMGKVYCLSETSDPNMITKTHQEAHGLAPARIHSVSDGPEASLTGKQLFLDIHRLEPGSVTAEAVAQAHDKDLAVQGKYDVNFINYWLDEKEGVIMCLSEAPDSSAVIKTHKEAHGLAPHQISEVTQGE